MEDKFKNGAGPKRFSYNVLAASTGNFSDEQKLGEGGFGSVYRGFLAELNLHVAIERVSKGSRQGRKEYASEVTVISRLRHRNLVQLIGWCHSHDDQLLLVYDLMPNGSLDAHLYSEEKMLPWSIRSSCIVYSSTKAGLDLSSSLFNFISLGKLASKHFINLLNIYRIGVYTAVLFNLCTTVVRRRLPLQVRDHPRDWLRTSVPTSRL